MAKSLYSALFDWIVFRTNHALLNNKDLEDSSKVGMETHTHTHTMYDRTHTYNICPGARHLLFFFPVQIL